MHLVFHLYVHIIEKGSTSSEFMIMNSMKFYSLTQLGRPVGQINNRHNWILDTFQVYFGTWSLSCFRPLQFSFFSRHTNTTKEILGQVLQVQCSLHTLGLALGSSELGLGGAMPLPYVVIWPLRLSGNGKRRQRCRCPAPLTCSCSTQIGREQLDFGRQKEDRQIKRGSGTRHDPKWMVMEGHSNRWAFSFCLETFSCSLQQKNLSFLLA